LGGWIAPATCGGAEGALVPGAGLRPVGLRGRLGPRRSLAIGERGKYPMRGPSPPGCVIPPKSSSVPSGAGRDRLSGDRRGPPHHREGHGRQPRCVLPVAVVAVVPLRSGAADGRPNKQGAVLLYGPNPPDCGEIGAPVEGIPPSGGAPRNVHINGSFHITKRFLFGRERVRFPRRDARFPRTLMAQNARPTGKSCGGGEGERGAPPICESSQREEAEGGGETRPGTGGRGTPRRHRG